MEDFVETWRIVLWNHVFWWLFKKGSSYSRSIPFKDQEGSDVAVKRVLYRYIVHFNYICLGEFQVWLCKYIEFIFTSLSL